MITAGQIIRQMSMDDLTEKISVIYHTTARNSRGDLVKGAENVRCMVWAKVLPLIGKISDSLPERVNIITYRITIRYRPDIKPNDEILWRGKKFKMITPPINIEYRNMWTQFDCTEVIKDGRTT